MTESENKPLEPKITPNNTPPESPIVNPDASREAENQASTIIQPIIDKIQDNSVKTLFKRKAGRPTNEERAKRPGRPKKVFTQIERHKISDYAARGLKTDQIAALMDMDDATINTYFKQIINKKRIERVLAIKDKQWEKAMSGDVALLCFLGKNEADQSDRPENGGSTANPIVLVYSGGESQQVKVVKSTQVPVLAEVKK